MKHIYKMRIRERQAQLRLEMLREDSLKREMIESMNYVSGRKLKKNEEKLIIARHEHDIKYR
jgi:hypothetical protein